MATSFGRFLLLVAAISTIVLCMATTVSCFGVLTLSSGSDDHNTSPDDINATAGSIDGQRSNVDNRSESIHNNETSLSWLRWTATLHHPSMSSMMRWLRRQRRDSGPDCIVESPLKRKQGLIIRNKMPDGFRSESCRTTLRSPEGKRFKVKLDHAMFNSRDSYVQIENGQQILYVDKSCSPCHEGNIQGSELVIQYRLMNNSRLQLRYSTNDNVCPFLTVMLPLRIRNKSSNAREVGATVELECLNDHDFVLVGNRHIQCVSHPDGTVAWSSPLPSCQRQSNCPRRQQPDRNGSGVIELTKLTAENYYCTWTIDGTAEVDASAKFVEFSVTIEPEALARSEYARRYRGLTFYDGEARIKVENGAGLRYRTRDPKLRINFQLSKSEANQFRDGSFRIEYTVVRKTCPTIDEEAFPFGTIALTDGYFVGTRATFSCAPGYYLHGAASDVVCQRDANWSFGTAIPECVPVSAETDENDIRAAVAKPPAGEGSRDDLLQSSSGATTTTTEQYAQTTKDSLAYTDWSVWTDRSGSLPGKIINEQQKQQQQQQHHQPAYNADDVPPRTIDVNKKSFGPGRTASDDQSDRILTDGILAANGHGHERAKVDKVDRNGHVFVNPNLKTTTVPPATTIGSMLAGATSSPPPPPEDPSTTLQSSSSLVERLLALDLRNKQDVKLLLVVLCAAFVVLLLLLLLIWAIGRGCREKVPIRENPLYTGGPPRRITNVSFRPSNRHKRAMQERTYT